MRVRDFAHAGLQSISGLVCEVLKSVNSPQIPDCLEVTVGESYFDITEAKPLDATTGFSTTQHWLRSRRNLIEPRRPFADSEQQVQQRPFWSLNLENLDFSDTGVTISHAAKTTTALAGISNPLLSNQGTTSIGADHKSRLVFDYEKGTNYLLTDSAFLRNTTTTSTPALVNNVLGIEAGGTVRLPVRHLHLGLVDPHRAVWARPSWLSLQYSIRYEKQLVDPENLYSTLAPLGPTVSLPTPKISTIYGRIGLRTEAGDTYFETGLEEIDSRGLLSNYALTPSAGAALYCQPGVSAALLCGPDPAPNSRLNVTPISNEAVLSTSTFTKTFTTASFRVPGAYLNFYWKFPILSRRDASRTDQSWYFTLTNKGDIYFNQSSDTAVQTRYLDKLTPALSFPIWGKISLTPKVDFVLYENKINYFHYRAIQPSVSVSYTFSMREGMTWTRALGYGAQTTKASPAGSNH